MNTVQVTKRMLSTEIAELCGKQHKDVMRDIRVVSEQMHSADLLFGCESTSYTASTGQPYSCYSLDHEATMIIVTGYDVVARTKVIRRWIELESQVAKPLSQLEILSQSISILTEQDRRITANELEVKQISAKVDDISIDLRNGVPHGFISKKLARVQSGNGLSKEVFEMALSDGNITTQKYIHYQECQAISTFAYKLNEIEPIISAFLADAVQVTKQMCFSSKLNKRFLFQL